MEETPMQETSMQETPMQEMPMSAEERLKNIDVERKRLRERVAKEKAERLSKAAGLRKERDVKNKQVYDVLVKVQKEIFAYNKSGKVLRAQNPILETIEKLVSPAEPGSDQDVREKEKAVEAETTPYY